GSCGASSIGTTPGWSVTTTARSTSVARSMRRTEGKSSSQRVTSVTGSRVRWALVSTTCEPTPTPVPMSNAPPPLLSMRTAVSTSRSCESTGGGQNGGGSARAGVTVLAPGTESSATSSAAAATASLRPIAFHGARAVRGRTPRGALFEDAQRARDVHRPEPLRHRQRRQCHDEDAEHERGDDGPRAQHRHDPQVRHRARQQDLDHPPQDEEPARDPGHRAEEPHEHGFRREHREHGAESQPEREHRRLLTGSLVAGDARGVERDQQRESEDSRLGDAEDPDEAVDLLTDETWHFGNRLRGVHARQP